MVVVNSGESYIGTEIRAWCENTRSRDARIVFAKYYSRKRQPNDQEFYFVEKESEEMSGYRVRRDLIKSPRTYSN